MINMLKIEGRLYKWRIGFWRKKETEKKQGIGGSRASR